jgi:hypothetical protein
MAFEYDIALSFAGEQRDYVRQVADILFSSGIKVFYDEFNKVDMWGENLFDYLEEVYNSKAKYCAIFVSKEYKEKIWTNHERENAQARALKSKETYILPIRFDDTKIAGLKETTSYLSAKNNTPEELARIIIKKINPNSDIDEMLNYLRDYLTEYEITQVGSKIHFKCDQEEWEGEFSLRLLLEMWKLGELENMFLYPGIVPF